MNDLRKCPFCGEPLVIDIDDEYGGVGVYHRGNKGLCIMPDLDDIEFPIGSTLQDMIDRLNTRPLEDALLKRAESAEAQLQVVGAQLKTQMEQWKQDCKRAESAEAKVKEMEAAQEWIPIATGRLPERGQECEVIDPAGYIHNWVHTDQLLNIFAKYTHWRPLTLPQPPKPEEGG